jgi:hypothetical protein
MDIELYSLLALAILLTSIATVLFALFTYVLFRIREGRKLRKQGAGHGQKAGPQKVAETPPPAAGEPKKETAQPRFFKPYQPGS